MIEVNEQCKKCFHFQVCANVLKQQLFIREKMLQEENPKCEHFIPTADVVEVRHGEWGDTGIEDLDLIYSGYKCSECGEIVCGTAFPYCPYCGAKMDGKEVKDA
jgi:hypothetical protein